MGYFSRNEGKKQMKKKKRTNNIKEPVTLTQTDKESRHEESNKKKEIFLYFQAHVLLSTLVAVIMSAARFCKISQLMISLMEWIRTERESELWKMYENSFDILTSVQTAINVNEIQFLKIVSILYEIFTLSARTHFIAL